MTKSDIQQLFSYTEWANALVLDAAEKLTREQLHADRQISYGSIFGTLSHMGAAEWLWLDRWRGNSRVGGNVWEEWANSVGTELASLRSEWLKVAEGRQALLASLSDADLLVEQPFKRMNGEEHSLPLGSQMQHVVNHATLHRGQVVGMIRQLGITPPATDYLFYLR
jgi:uncharacterized damage-inducible protein DinB